MNRTEKSQAVSEMAETFRLWPHVIVTSFQGLTANQSVELRRKIRAAGGAYQVVKNRLARRAAEGTAVERVRDALTGPRALAAHTSDPVALAKVLTEFAKENPQIELIKGVVDGREVMDAAGIKALATLPGLPELRSRLLAVIQMPATLLTRVLVTPAQQVARVIDARREKLQSGGE